MEEQLDARFAQPADMDPALAEGLAAMQRELTEHAGDAVRRLEDIAAGRDRRPVRAAASVTP